MNNKSKQEKKVEEKSISFSNPGLVVSRLDHPVTLSYDGEGFVLPPRGREKVDNLKKLGALPKGVSIISQK